MNEKLIRAIQDKTGLPEHDIRQLMNLVAAQERREREALKLYEPLDWQDEFHRSLCKERVCLAANQDGKSIAGYVELVRAVTGQDPHNKYPKKDGVAVIVGWDEKFLGLNPYRYLLKPGAFKIIKDEETHQWRAYRPWTDKHRENETYPAPQLLPPRFIDGEPSWLRKKDNIFSKINLTNGWTILAFSSKGDPSPGFQADLVLIDEDIYNPAWYSEMVARLTIRKGGLVWAALPLNSNNEFANLLDRHEMEQELPDEQKTTMVFKPYRPNPYIDTETREANAKKWLAAGTDVYRARALGEIATDSWRMYPTFDPRRTHNIQRTDYPREFSEIFEQLAKNGFTPPADWSRYMVVDPGHTVCAVLFGATPPSGAIRYIYQECYIQKCDAEKFGSAIELHVQNWNFEAFIIDSHGGRLREIGSGLTPREQYESVMRSRHIESNQTGSGFIDGCDNIKGREVKLQTWLNVRPEGLPTVLVNPDTCPMLVKEMKNFKKKKDPATGMPTDDGYRRSFTHAVEGLEYLSAHGMPYIKPREQYKLSSQDLWVERVRRRQRMEALSKQSGIVLGPQPPR